LSVSGVLDSPGHGYFNEDADLLRSTTRMFVEREILPQVETWEESGSFPRDLYAAAGAVGILGIGYPEDVGGTPTGLFGEIAVWEELARCGSGGVGAGLGSHNIALPPILLAATTEQQARFIPPVLRGERIAALGITEPDAGSDVAALRTTARRDGDAYIVNGAKTFITSGTRADQVTTAVRTGGEGHHGISLLVIEAGTPGFERSAPMRKMGWWASDTATLSFVDCRVPVANRIGAENAGFPMVMANFERERLQLAISANVTAELALLTAWEYATQRQAFGRPLTGFQVTRHKLVDLATDVVTSKELTYRTAARMEQGLDQMTEVSMAKIVATRTVDHVTHEAVQIFGGAGYVRGNLVERLARDGRLLSIGGGTTEIMKEIIAKRIL
jgi:acyl-CoA dehydrogenase